MLPIWSIVYLSAGQQKMMVLNRGAIVEQDGQDVVFDYTGAMYPNGLDPQEVFYFNAEDVDKVLFEGFKDADEERFQTLYEQWREKRTDLKKGRVTPLV